MKAAWVGCIALGRLGIPVRLYSASRSIRPRFIQLHDADGSKVERVLFCRDEQREIAPAEIIRAAKHESGQLVPLTDQEIKRAASVNKKVIEIKQFARITEVPLLYFDKPYYVVPHDSGEKAYALLREALSKNDAAAVATFVMYTSEKIGLLAVHEDVLMLYQLRFSEEIVPRSDLHTPPLPKASPQELDVMQNVIELYRGPLHLRDYHDEHTEHLDTLIERKAKGLPPPRSRQLSTDATPDEHILEALRDTIAGGRQMIAADARQKTHKAM